MQDTLARYQLTIHTYVHTIQFGLESPTKKGGIITRRCGALDGGTSLEGVIA